MLTGRTYRSLIMKDIIVEKIHEIRKQHAEEFNFDLNAIVNDLIKIEKTCGHKIIKLPPKFIDKTKNIKSA
jgi:hypothetical protein